jgi:hypothetical protein
MGFNKRIFSMEMLSNYYLRDNVSGIHLAIGKTDGFIFRDKLSSKVVDLWCSGNEDEARKIMEEYVLRIPSQVSTDGR